MENGFCPENKTTSKVRDDRKHLSVYYSIAYYQTVLTKHARSNFRSIQGKYVRNPRRFCWLKKFKKPTTL